MVVLRSNFAAIGIQIQPFDESPNEQVVQDLHVGEIYNIPGEGRSDPHKIDSKYVLLPGRSVVLYTQEKITINSGEVFGQITSKASWISQGIIIANTKVDPFFGVGTPNSSLRVLVFNSGESPFVIEAGKPFCSIYFLKNEGTVPNSHPRNPPSWPSQRENPIPIFLSRNKIVIATLLGSILGGIVGAWFTTYFSNGIK